MTRRVGFNPCTKESRHMVKVDVQAESENHLRDAKLNDSKL